MVIERGRGACAALITAVALVLVGCGTQPGPDGDAPGPPTSPSDAPVLTAGMLLTAEQMPAWNDAMGWREAELPAGERALALCVLPSAGSLGADRTLERTFEAAGVADPGTTPDPTWPPSYGVNVVGRFVDGAAAAAAVAAWEAALGDCVPGEPDAADVDSARISDLSAGSTWTVSAPDPSQACPECLRFEFIGVASKGTVVSLVGFALSGQDANYEGDPLADSMDASLQRLP